MSVLGCLECTWTALIWNTIIRSQGSGNYLSRNTIFLKTNLHLNVNLTFSGGTFGDVIVYYSTSAIDLKTLAQSVIPAGSDYLWFYDGPVTGNASVSGTALDKSSQPNPLQVKERETAIFCHFMISVTIMLCNAI